MPQGTENEQHTVRYPSRMSEMDLSGAEYAALRATIRERGTARMVVLIIGFAAWGALAIGVALSQLEGAVVLVPFVILVAAFEINFFLHIGVERIGFCRARARRTRCRWTPARSGAREFTRAAVLCVCCALGVRRLRGARLWQRLGPPYRWR